MAGVRYIKEKISGLLHYNFRYEAIKTHASAFFMVIILSIAGVAR